MAIHQTSITHVIVPQLSTNAARSMRKLAVPSRLTSSNSTPQTSDMFCFGLPDAQWPKAYHLTSRGREYGLGMYLHAHSHIIKDMRAVSEAQVAHQKQHNQASKPGCYQPLTP